MQLPTRTRRKRSNGLLSNRSCANAMRKRMILWMCACCASLMLLRSLLYSESSDVLVHRSYARHTSSQFSTQHQAVLLDGKTVPTHSLPSIYPNGDVNRFSCDLPALRYACDMDKQHGCRAYPQLFKAGDLMRHWSPNDIDIPTRSYSSVCRFNVSSRYELALAHVFHTMEVPFIIYGIPELTAASTKWTSRYLIDKLGPEEQYKVHVANSTHFMYYSRRTAQPPQAPPVVVADVSDKATRQQPQETRPYESQWLRYTEFLNKISTSTRQFFYLMLKADDIRQRASFVLHDLPFLDPDASSQPHYGDLFLRDLSFARAKGMRCRFGMAGIITEGHVDAGLNMVAMVRGHKRYVLSPPSVCACLALHTSGPSMRHTAVDWADVATGGNKTLYDCPATEVVVGEGDVLYIPSYWYHHIVSLDQTIQCNVRSGIIARDDVKQFLQTCGLAGF